MSLVDRKIARTMRRVERLFPPERVHDLTFNEAGDLTGFGHDLTPAELKTLLDAIEGAWDTYSKYDPDNLKGLSPDQVKKWIDDNVKDLTSARKCLKWIAVALLFLLKREEE